MLTNGGEMFVLQGNYTNLALRDIGTFLRYMESEYNVKVSD